MPRCRPLVLACTAVLALVFMITGAGQTPPTGTLGSSTTRLVNLSVRASSESGAGVLIAGFTIAGAGTKPLLIRGIGPTLLPPPFNLTSALADSRLELYSGQNRIAENDNWAAVVTEAANIAALAARVGAFPLAPGSRDAATFATLPPGGYTVQIAGGNNTAGMALAEIYDADPAVMAASGRLSNLSARARTGASPDVLITGFTIAGTGVQRVLIRGVGPTLARFNVAGLLADPKVEVFSGTALVAANDNWSTQTGGVTPADVQAAAASVGAFALDANSQDAALLLTLPPGGYTVHVAGVDAATGVALAELYEVAPASTETVITSVSGRISYVAPDGSDSSPGTFALPYATLSKATGLANPGDLIYVRGGTYTCTARIYITRSGTAANPIHLRAYPGEHPVLDFTPITDVSLYGISIAASYWRLFGLEVFNTPGNGIRMVGHDTINPAGSYNVIERCVARNSRNTGIAIGSGSALPFLPGNNLILNCDSIRSYDAVNHGEDADGFSAKFNLGAGNVFRGCRAWENSDDGWDLWMAIAPVLIENCWAFGNGQNLWGDRAFTGNGNGFKLGGNYVAAPHRLVRSLACYNVGNGGNGIDQNNNTAAQTVDQNTVWGNRAAAINLNHSAARTEPHVVRNNLVIDGRVTFTSATTASGNSWQVLAAAPVAADFAFMNTATDSATVALITALLAAPRRDDGSLPEILLARPRPGGRLVDTGTIFDDRGYLGYTNTHQGAAPDLGAFETPAR